MSRALSMGRDGFGGDGESGGLPASCERGAAIEPPMMAQSRGDSTTGVARLVRAAEGEILSAWARRVQRLPAIETPSLTTRGTRLLAWLSTALEHHARDESVPRELFSDESFSAPRSIAELALLAETIDEVLCAGDEDLGRVLVHDVIDTAIAGSIARDGDENERLRKRLQLATDVTQVGSWDFDPVTGIVGADERSRELFGIVDGQGATVDALTLRVHADDRDRVRSGIGGTLASGRPYVDACRTVAADGVGRWIAIAADAHHGVCTPLPGVIGIVHDITDRKRMEEDHARVVEELSRAVHISEMFVGILSHDLRNPLGAILAGAQLLGMSLSDERSASVVKRVVSSGMRMGRIRASSESLSRAGRGARGRSARAGRAAGRSRGWPPRGHRRARTSASPRRARGDGREDAGAALRGPAAGARADGWPRQLLPSTIAGAGQDAGRRERGAFRRMTMNVKYQLELFVVGRSSKAQKAEHNLRRLCDAKLSGRYELRITDVLENADAAEAANIVATPALVRRAPLPVRMVVGDLSERDALLHGLGLEADGDDLDGNTEND
jgi:circadian clock protein KaiB